ncbi:MAG: (d)CMP kinase [bacterium]|nr:MAG: (d)CMP kinase [bacterium]
MNRDEKIRDSLERLVVTIDGPAGSGKSTTASMLADRLGLKYLDTGAMYRAVTWSVLQQGIDPESETDVTRVAETMELELRTINGKATFFLEGKNIDTEIRSSEVSRYVSPVSRYPGVRRAMVKLQRMITKDGGVVVEGRDTGSVVFPFAHIKVFLVAEISERALRRRKQLETIGIEQDINEITENILERDRIDSSRDHSPLVRPVGSILVDTSNLSIDEQVSMIETEVRNENERLADLRVGRGEKNPFGAMSLYYRISHFLVRWFFKLIFGLRITGSENLEFKENLLFASNHLSYADPPIVGCALNREVWFVAKKELFKNRLFAWLIRTYHAIEIDREEISRKSIKTILGILRKGMSVLMFPEGTRSLDGDLGELKSGLGFVARLSGTTIIPVYASGTNELKQCFLRRKKLEVRIGPPIRVRAEGGAESRKNDNTILSSMVRQALRILKDEAQN